MLVLLVLGGVFVAFAAIGARSSSSPPPSPQAAELRAAMRKLWEDHIVYTRNLIISAIAQLPDQDAVLQRLLKNQDAIGDAIRPYYGQDAAHKLAALLRDHILIAVDVVKAAASGDQHLVQMQQQRWSANGSAIAAFLSSANPNLPKGLLEQMLQKHLDLTTKEVVSRLHHDWASDIASYDEGHDHMLMFSDTLADGIAKQQQQGSASDRGESPKKAPVGRGTYS